MLVNATIDVVGEEVLRQVKTKKQKKKKDFWVKHMFTVRHLHGHMDILMEDMLENYPADYRRFIRMSNELMEEILAKIAHRIQRQDTPWRSALKAKLKLVTTLRYLATGDCYPSCVTSFRVSKSSVVNFIPEVCDAIYEEYEAEVMRCPNSEQEWRAVAEGFHRKWNFPHAIGALDRKHINYRLSRARRVVENAFGILSSRFRCLHTTMPQKPERVASIVLACCTLHNLIRLHTKGADLGIEDAPGPAGSIVPGRWREHVQLDGGRAAKNTDANAGKRGREELKKYFVGAGSVDWQEERIA
jgi:hypothetical protein